jgi:hypothetical protein
MQTRDLKVYEKAGSEDSVYGGHILVRADVLLSWKQLEQSVCYRLYVTLSTPVNSLTGLSRNWPDALASCCSLQANRHLNSCYRTECETRRQLPEETTFSLHTPKQQYQCLCQVLVFPASSNTSIVSDLSTITVQLACIYSL